MLAALALVVVGALWLSETDVNKKKVDATARGSAPSAGSASGAPVTLRGVKVGRVEAIRLVEDEWVETEFSIDRERATCRAKPAVISASASLFGEWSANIISYEPLPDRSQPARRADRVGPAPAATPGPARPCPTSAS